MKVSALVLAPPDRGWWLLLGESASVLAPPSGPSRNTATTLRLLLKSGLRIDETRLDMTDYQDVADKMDALLGLTTSPVATVICAPFERG